MDWMAKKKIRLLSHVYTAMENAKGAPSEGVPYLLFPLIKKVGAYGYFIIQKSMFRCSDIDQLLRFLNYFVNYSRT